jgi:hypothetical protein
VAVAVSTAAGSVVAVSMAAGSVVADALLVEELGIAEAELALAACASRDVFRALKAQDHAFLHLGVHRTRNLSQGVL